MEKLDLLVWSAEAVSSARSLDVPGLRSVAISEPAGLEKPTLLMGLGPSLAGLVELWVDSVDVWPAVVEQVPSDAYLVTESVPQQKSSAPGLLTHLSWFPKPERLTDEQFFHGWHMVHTPTTGALHPLRQGYVRDAVARRLTPDSAPVRAIVSEYFAVEDYLDPARLFGSPEALQASVDELPLYADYDDVSTCPLLRKN
ncbi:MAG: EthD domain-containing protein [Mycobacteriales bacterium]